MEEDFLFDGIGGKHVAATYFNTAFDNFYKTIGFIFKQIDFTEKSLNQFFDYKEEKIANILQSLYILTFKDKPEQEETYHSIREYRRKILLGDAISKYKDGLKKNDEEGKYKNVKTKDIVLDEQDKSRIEQEVEEILNKQIEKIKEEKKLVISDDRLMKFQKLLFNKIPGFAPMMAEVVSHENKKIQDELNNKETSEDRKEELKKKQKGMTYSMLFEKVVLVAETLLYYRNYYTHKNPYNDSDALRRQSERECKLFFIVKSVFDGSRRIDKRRNLVSTKKMEDLTGNRDGQRKKKEPIEGKTKDNGQPIFRFIESDDFYFKIIGNQYIGDKVKGYELSDFGRMLFCCMFLSRHDILQFIEKENLMEQSPFKLKEYQIRQKQEDANKRRNAENAERAAKNLKPLPPIIIKDHESDTNEIVKDIMCLYHIRLPRERRIDSQETKETLTMDILNELRRCPSELYESFSPDGKKKFEREVIPDEANGTSDKTKLIRSKDRFPHLALRYIDQTEAIGDIRFQVRLGCYRYCFYNKICIDGKPDVRVWQKEINGFGLYQDIEVKRKTDWEKLFQDSEEKIVDQKYGEAELLQLEKDKAGQKDYVTDSKTSYNIHANRIGMTWGLEDGYCFPNLKRVPKEKTEEKETFLAPESEVTMITPKCSMSTYDLPALLFYKYLHDDYGNRYHLPDVETIIKNKYTGLVEFFTAVKDGKSREDLNIIISKNGIKSSDLPQTMNTYLNLFKENIGQIIGEKKHKHVEQELKDQLERVQRRLEVFDKKRKKIESNDNKVGSKGYEDIRHGTLARYLAKSLLMWQPTRNKGKDKLTGLNYNKMMSFLAAYGQKSDLEDLKKVLTNSGLLGGSNPHPFISAVLDKKPLHTEKLYVEYLKQEKRVIKDLLVIIRLEKRAGNIESYKKNEEKLLSSLNESQTIEICKRLAAIICNWTDMVDADKNLPNWLNQIISSGKIEKIKGKFKKKGLLRSTGHPFLYKAFSENVHSVKDLYKSCLEMELKHLSQLSPKMPIPFVHEDAEKWRVNDNDTQGSYYRNYASRYLKIDEKHDSIILLPDGLFTDAIIEIISKIVEDENNKLGTTNEVAKGLKNNLKQMLTAKSNDNNQTLLCKNASYIIQTYFKDVMADKNQPFYTAEGIYKRAYDPFTTLYGMPIGNTTELERYYMDADDLKTKLSMKMQELNDQIDSRKNIKDKNAFKTTIKSKINEVKGVERTIRRYKTQDVVLFICAKKLLLSIITNAQRDQNDDAIKEAEKKVNDLKLMNFDFSEGFSFLNEGENGANLSYEYNYKGIKITQEGLSLKNYGNVYRVLGDSRFASLMEGLKKVGVTKVTFGDLTSEFAIYDDKRPDIFKTVQEIEDKAKKENEAILNDPSNIGFYSYDKDGNKMAKRNSFNALISLLQEYDEDDKSVMIDIRNAVGHGHYRLKLKFNELEKEEGQTYDVPNIARLMNETMAKSKDHKIKKKEEKKENE